MNTPNGFEEVLRIFGDPRTDNAKWQAANLIEVHCPFLFRYFDDDGSLSVLSHIRLHKLVAEPFTSVQADVLNYLRLAVKKEQGFDKTSHFYDVEVQKRIEADGYDIFGGSYNYRPIRGTVRKLSLHSFGIAIDMDPDKNPRQSVLKTSFPDWYINTWKRHGWFWGGDFRSLRDSMHFQYATGC